MAANNTIKERIDQHIYLYKFIQLINSAIPNGKKFRKRLLETFQKSLYFEKRTTGSYQEQKISVHVMSE